MRRRHERGEGAAAPETTRRASSVQAALGDAAATLPRCLVGGGGARSIATFGGRFGGWLRSRRARVLNPPVRRALPVGAERRRSTHTPQARVAPRDPPPPPPPRRPSLAGPAARRGPRRRCSSGRRREPSGWRPPQALRAARRLFSRAAFDRGPPSNCASSQRAAPHDSPPSLPISPSFRLAGLVRREGQRRSSAVVQRPCAAAAAAPSPRRRADDDEAAGARAAGVEDHPLPASSLSRGEAARASPAPAPRLLRRFGAAV